MALTQPTRNQFFGVFCQIWGSFRPPKIPVLVSFFEHFLSKFQKRVAIWGGWVGGAKNLKNSKIAKNGQNMFWTISIINLGMLLNVLGSWDPHRSNLHQNVPPPLFEMCHIHISIIVLKYGRKKFFSGNFFIAFLDTLEPKKTWKKFLGQKNFFSKFFFEMKFFCSFFKFSRFKDTAHLR